MNNRHTGLLVAASTCFGQFVGDGLLPCALGCLHLLTWLPMINAVGTANWSLGFVALVPPCAFLFTAALAVVFAQNALDGADVPVRLLSAAVPALSVAGCIAGIPAGGIPSQTLALTLFGAAYGSASALWFHDAMHHKAATLAVAVLVGTAVCAGISSAALHWGTGPAYVIATVGAATSSASRPHPVREGRNRDTASRKPGVSKLLELTTSRLAMRHMTAFFALGLLTGAMLTMFTMGMPDPDIGAVGAGLPAGALALILLVGIGWAINREPSFTHSFEFSFLVALLAFFPFYPGTAFNQQLSLVLGSTWATVLIGLALLVSYEISLACAPAQRHLFGTAFSALLMGMACGIAGMAVVLGSAWFTGMDRGSYHRITFVTTTGACAIVLSYVCSNILLKRSLVRDVRLAAQGKFATLVQPASPPKDVSGVHGTSIEACCRDIALRYGCTPREYDLLVVLAHGNSLARAQEELVISEGTAITHRRNLYRKLGVTSRQELMDFVHSAQKDSGAEPAGQNRTS